jgi:hypothetical protein
MSTDERVKRPEPERTGPVRNWSTLFGGADTADAGSLGDAVSRSVELGYRVVDEYVRRGQKAAQRLSERPYGAEGVVRDVGELTARMAQYAADFLGVWFQFVELAAAGSAARAAASSPNGDAGPAPGPAPTPPTPEAAVERNRVRIEVASTQPAEVSLDLRPEAARMRLVVHALRSVDPAKPHLTDVVLESGHAEEPLSVRIRVPADHPPGVYNGLIVDEGTSRLVGTLTVRVGSGP